MRRLFIALLPLLAAPCAALQEARRQLYENPTLPPAGRVAIVLRGQAFRCKANASLPDGLQNRSACCGAAVPMQEEATASLLAHVIQPLEARGVTVEIVVTDGACNLTARGVVGQLRRERKGGKDEVRRVIRFEQRDCTGPYPQNENIRFALETFKAAVPGGVEEIATRYDLVLLLRHDILWKRPIDQWWEADFSKFNFASRCRERKWATCINDVIHTMPGRLFPAFDSEVGTKRCFNVPNPRKCKGGHHCIWDSGHFCIGQLSKRLGAAEVGLVTQWRPEKQVREPNEIWDLYDVAEE